MLSPDDWLALPGGDLIRSGVADLEAGALTISALLVSIGAPRLRRSLDGLPETALCSPEHRLYELLAQEDPRTAHSRYNAYIRRLVSFERAAECVS